MFIINPEPEVGSLVEVYTNKNMSPPFITGKIFRIDGDWYHITETYTSSMTRTTIDRIRSFTFGGIAISNSRYIKR